MRQNIKKLIDATCVIDKTYFIRSRNMAAKPNIVVLMSAMDSDENLSQRKLHTDWLLPLSAINTIAAIRHFPAKKDEGKKSRKIFYSLSIRSLRLKNAQKQPFFDKILSEISQKYCLCRQTMKFFGANEPACIVSQQQQKGLKYAGRKKHFCRRRGIHSGS